MQTLRPPIRSLWTAPGVPVHRTMLLFAAVVWILISSATLLAAGYYVSPNGNDDNPGSQGSPWKSLAKINATPLAAGDHVFLASGATFEGNIVLTAAETGMPGKPIVIGSTDGGRATIISLKHTAISAVCGEIVLHNLMLRGEPDEAGKNCGIAFLTDSKSGVKYRNVVIDNVDVSGFGGAGISIGSSGDALSGYEDVRITHANIHDNGGDGLISFDKSSSTKPVYAHKDFYIADCTLSGNHTGTGMVLSAVDHALIEYCRAFDNRGKTGGLGMWAWESKDLVFQYCISSGTNTNNGGDGGGYDLDGGCVDCAVRYCLSYGNDGPGYMHCDFPAAPPTHDNIISSCISVNDGRKPKGAPLGFGFCVWGSGLDDCTIANNLSIASLDDPAARQNSVLFASYIPEPASDLSWNHDQQHFGRCVFRDNTTYVAGSGIAYVAADVPNSATNHVLFVGNTYRSDGAMPPLLIEGTTRYDSIDAWRKATGQESNYRQPPLALPKIDSGSAASLSLITDPHSLVELPLMKELKAEAGKT